MFINHGVRRMMSSLAAVPEKYPGGMQFMHWTMGAGIVTCVATVKIKQDLKEKETFHGWGANDLMHLHKSMALVVAALLVPRVAIRLASKVPALPEGNAIERGLGYLSHMSMYALMIGLPTTGIIMGYFSGKGLPFFSTKIEGSKEPNKQVAGKAFKAHKFMGQGISFLIPLHVGATGVHIIRGQNILWRMLP